VKAVADQADHTPKVVSASLEMTVSVLAEMRKWDHGGNNLPMQRTSRRFDRLRSLRDE